MSLIGKPAMLKEVNSSLIERVIYKRGPLSKSMMAEITNLSIPTVNKIVDSLEKAGRVSPVGLTTEGVGRKAILYEINKDSGCIIALYYTREKYFCRLSDIAGNTLHEELCEIDNSTPESVMESTISAVEKMSEHAPSEVKTIGVGVPGVVTPEGGLWGIPKIGVWEGFNLEEALSEYYDSDIYIENDVKLSTVGYYLTRLSDELDNMAYIYAGNGMGSGIIINKKLYRGSTNFSGELGYMAPLDGTRPQQDYTLDGGYLERKLNPLTSRGGHDGANGEEGETGASGGNANSGNANGVIGGSASGVIGGNANGIIGGSANGEEGETGVIGSSANNSNSGNANEVLVNYFAAVAANYISIIDPDAIVFGGEAFSEALVDEIRSCLVHYSPSRSIPQVIYNDNDGIGLVGLVLACMGNITPVVQLVENGGI